MATQLLRPPCPLCGSDSYRDVIRAAKDRLGRKPGEFQVAACTRCGLAATRPQPSPALLASYYDGMYSGAGGKAARSWQTGAIGRWVARRRANLVMRHAGLRSGGRVLDVGCGYGTFLAALADASTCELVGIDTDAGSIAHALRHERIRYECGGVDSAALEAGSFDAVTMFESLEHHRDPLEALRRALRLLKPGGVCVVEVPNWAGAWRRVFGSWWMPLLVPQHLYHFTPASLREAMVAAGFEVRDRHRSMFYPLESTASLALWLNEYMGRPIRRYRLQLRRPDGLLLVALLAAWWLAVELPAQAALMLAGRTGHQALVGFRPAEFR